MHQTHLRCEAVSLRETLPKARFISGQDVAARSCASDWRACCPGDVFFAITDADEDGHDHVDQAVARGAVAVVAERLLPVEGPQVLVPHARAAFARVCQALAGNPSRELTTIGVTGTAGKTVTSLLLASIFEAASQAAGVMSSIGYSDSVVQTEATGATPAPAEFASWLGRMRTAGCDAAVLELSSEALAQRHATGIALDAAILTSIKSGHLDKHNSAAAYQRIKRRIFNLLKPSGIAVVNADDHRCRNLLTNLKKPSLTYALHAQADLTARVLDRCPSEQTFLLTAGGDSAPVRTRMIGDQHVSNCLAAAAAGLALGMELNTIVRGLEAVDRVPGRMERLECGQPFSVFVDAAATPEALSLAIKTLRQVTRGRVLVVFGPQAALEPSKKALLGRVLERAAHVPILTSDSPACVQPLEMIHQLLDGFNRPHKARIIPDRAAAICDALAHARPGDSVLIAGRDNHGFHAAGDDDREIACRWLYSSAVPAPAFHRLRVVG